LDRDGRYITNLKKEDFQVYENGVEQEVTLFETVEQPVTVLLLLDLSGSMIKDLAQLTDASNAFVNQLRPNDKLMVATFDERVHLLFNAKSVKEVRERKKLPLKINGSAPETMVYDAVEFSIKKMKKISGRKAIILFSDGMGKAQKAISKTRRKMKS
jgi:VWFA-related protein